MTQKKATNKVAFFVYLEEAEIQASAGVSFSETT